MLDKETLQTEYDITMERFQKLNIEFKNKELEWKSKFKEISQKNDSQRNEVSIMEKQIKTRILKENLLVKYSLALKILFKFIF